MDVQIFTDIADTTVKLKMFPYFDAANYILMSMAVREDTPQTGYQNFSRKHPFACWVATMVMSFAGGFLTNFLLGEPLITPLTNTDGVLMATIIWYLINYSPFDVVYKLCRLLPFKIIICLFKEVQRTRKIQDGVYAGLKKYPDAYIICCVLGVVKGAGYNEMRLIERLVRGVWLPASNEFLRPTFTTKAGLVVSIAFLADKLGHITIGHNLVYLSNMGFLVYFRLTSLLLGINDPFVPIENLFCAIFMGGLVDAVHRLFQRTPVVSADAPGTANGHAVAPNALTTNGVARPAKKTD